MYREAKELGNNAEAPGTLSLGWRERVLDLQRVELATVRSQAELGRRAVPRAFALALNHLGNGWLYPLLAVALVWHDAGGFIAVAQTALVAAGIAHLLYPMIKHVVARPRPFEADPEMPAMLRPLDRYSFPSGHTMTVTAVAIPVSVVHPELLVPAALACAVIAWARLVAGHHYPSDILAGVALGAMVSLPVALILL